MLTILEIIIATAIGFVGGLLTGVVCCARPHTHNDETVALKITEGKDEY